MERYRVRPNTKIKLKDWDPDDRAEFKGSKEEGKLALPALSEQIEKFQELLYA